MRLVLVVPLAAWLIVSACRAQSVEVGRIVDVYGLRAGAATASIVPYRRAVFVAADVAAPAASASYSLLPCNPDTRRKRILIPAPVDSAAFAETLRELESRGQPLGESMPRNAALCLHFADAAAASRAASAAGIELRIAGEAAPRAIVTLLRGADVLVETTSFGSDLLPGAPGGPLPEGGARLSVGGEPVHEGLLSLQGFLPDLEPLRIVGQMDLSLERVAARTDGTRVLTLFLRDVRHAIDRGDVLAIYPAGNERAAVVVEVLADSPTPSGGAASRVHVRIDPVLGDDGEDVLERLDPSNRRDYPRDGLAARDVWLVANAPRVRLFTHFEPERGDDANNFVRFVGGAMLDTDANALDVAPDAVFCLDFSGPVDFATLNSLVLVTGDGRSQVPVRVFASDDSGMSFRLSAPLGLCLTPAMRRQIQVERERPATTRQPSYVLRVVGGAGGLRAVHQAPMTTGLEFPFLLDAAAPDNLVAWRVFGGK